MKWLETDSLSNQDISSALAIGAYTSDGDRAIYVNVCVDAVAGDGDYTMYVTKQIAGAGSAYVMLPRTTMTALAGDTAIGGQSGLIIARNTDVLTVYVVGLAGDDTTPDTTVIWVDASKDIVLGATQGGVTFNDAININGQVRVRADVADEGALDFENAHEHGYGNRNRGGLGGQYNTGESYGQQNVGNVAGQDNNGADDGVGQRNSGYPKNVSGFDSDIATASALQTVDDKVDNLDGDVADVFDDVGDVKAVVDEILADTGTTLPTSIDAIATWAAANISSSVTAGAISQIRGNSWDFPIDDLTLDDTLIQFVIKNNANDLDEDSILMIDNVTGLLYVNGEAGTAGDASLAYAGTTLTVEVVAGVTALLPAGVYHYGIQSIDGSGNVSEAYGGTFTITADMVRATTAPAVPA